jgi:hypothetical protein
MMDNLPEDLLQFPLRAPGSSLYRAALFPISSDGKRTPLSTAPLSSEACFTSENEEVAEGW